VGQGALIDRDIFAAFASAEQTHWWFAARRSILRRMVDAMRPSARGRGRVLDIGCGVASTLTAFHPDYSCVGYDLSGDAIEFARVRHAEFELHVGSSSDAAKSVGAADVVLLNDVIEHVPDDRAMLAEVVHAMRPGALLVITVPADMKLWSPHDEKMGHYRRYDEAMLARSVEGMALEQVMVSHFMSRLYPIVRAVRAVSRRRGRAAGVSGIDLSYPPRPVNALLREIFAGEGDRLLRVLRGDARPYSHGVSLLGAYRRA
jgi:2-polyprenyl-3-methyl-5-hydroxy-6-metoxy-1,4-benzoquinol methylase